MATAEAIEATETQEPTRELTWIEEQLAANPMHVFELDPDNINDLEIDPARNHRPTPPIGDKSLKDLVGEIERMGYNQVPTLADINPATGAASIFAGFRRARSVQTLRKAGSKIMLRVIVTPQTMTDEDAYLHSVSENLQRDDVNLMDRSATLVHMMKVLHMTGKEISQYTRMSQGSISVVARFELLPEITKKAISKGQCSYNTAAIFVGMLPKQAELLADADGSVLAAAQDKIAKMTEKELADGGKVKTTNVDRISRKKADAENPSGGGKKAKQRKVPMILSELREEKVAPANADIAWMLELMEKYICGMSLKTFLNKLGEVYEQS